MEKYAMPCGITALQASSSFEYGICENNINNDLFISVK